MSSPSRSRREAPLDTTLIQIDATSTSPVQAADIANATSQSLTNVVQSIEPSGNAGSEIKLTRVQRGAGADDARVARTCR